MKKLTNGISKRKPLMKINQMKTQRKADWMTVFQHLCSTYTNKESGKSQMKIHEAREFLAKMIKDQVEQIESGGDVWCGPIGQLLVLAYEKVHNPDL